MKVLVACEMSPSALEELRSLAGSVEYLPAITSQDLRGALSDAGILVVGGIRVSAETIRQAKPLQLIVHAGPGPGDVAMEETSNHGIFIADCPDQHAAAVAELAFALILALDRHLPEYIVATREGRRPRADLPEARGLAGRTLGILGYGPVGRLLARRALSFDMHVLAWSPSRGARGESEPEVEFCNWPRELARRADVVSVHSVEEEESGQLIDAEFLDSMQPGACLVHVGHPAAADEAALIDAVMRKQLRVGVDLFAAEAGADHARLRCRMSEMPGVICTHHIGPATQQARQATADEIVRIVRAFLVSGEVRNCLNMAERSPATWQLVLRVRDQVGVMAAILEAVRADGINAEEISSRVFTGAKAAWCTIAMDERPSNEALDAIRSLADVLHVELRAVV